MKQKRRDFFKTLGIGSVAFTIFPANQFPSAFSQTEIRFFLILELNVVILFCSQFLSGYVI